jgi:flagellar M-ring protein FliF
VRLNYDRVKQVTDHLVSQGKDGNGLVVRQKSSNTHGPATPEGDAGRSGGDAELEFAHGREQEEVERAPGRIERISMGVLVPVGTGDAVVARLRDVIGAAVGLDTQRGDRLDIAAVAAPLRVPAPVAAPTARQAVKPAAGALASSWQAELPGWGWIALGVVLVASIAGGSYGVALRRARPARLTDAQRASMLSDVRQWIAHGENA